MQYLYCRRKNVIENGKHIRPKQWDSPIRTPFLSYRHYNFCPTTTGKCAWQTDIFALNLFLKDLRLNHKVPSDLFYDKIHLTKLSLWFSKFCMQCCFWTDDDVLSQTSNHPWKNSKFQNFKHACFRYSFFVANDKNQQQYLSFWKVQKLLSRPQESTETLSDLSRCFEINLLLLLGFPTTTTTTNTTSTRIMFCTKSKQ
jgi:hypothetical protein